MEDLELLTLKLAKHIIQNILNRHIMSKTNNKPYHDPATVLSPKDLIESVQIIYDGGISNRTDYSIAIINNKGLKSLGIRWNITHRERNDPTKGSGLKKYLGEPSSRGYPTWFIIPPNLVNSILNGLQLSSDDRKKLTDSSVGEIQGDASLNK